uniref:Uncharacterized protein n=1 Tax=Arcella intermedia TaxID=1963864 RepID=A0A6B2L7E6_9EUKA
MTGVTEDIFRLYPEKYISEGPHGNLQITNINNQTRINAGIFSLLSFGDIEKKLRDVSGQRKKSPVPIEILTCNQSAYRKVVDVSYLQSLPENRNAVFQVASNFNGVESVSETSFPTDPNYLTDYIYDKTQGPIASIGAGGAAITRLYPFYKKGTSSSQWIQTETRQVNFLEKLWDYFPIMNGYVILNHFSKPLPDNEDLLGKTLIGYHKDVEVVFAEQQARKYRKINDPNQLIDQVFCAAMNMAQGHSGRSNKSFPDSYQKAYFLLQAAYQGSYLVALENSRKKLFLTMIGGGVFGNPHELIYEAIIDAHLKFSQHPASNLEKVSLVLYSGQPSASFLQGLEKHGIPYTLLVDNNPQKSKL